MPARSQAFHEGQIDKKINDTAPKKKQSRHQARNGISTQPRPKPKSKKAGKIKTAQKRADAKASAPAPIRKDRRRELEAGCDQPIVSTPKPKKPEFSTADIKRKAECEAAIEKALPVSRDEILAAAIVEFEQSLVKSTVNVADSFGMCRELDARSLDRLFYDEDKPESRIMPSRSFFLKVAEKMIIAKNPGLHLRRTFYPGKRSAGKKRASEMIAANTITTDVAKAMKKKMAREVPFDRWLSHVALNKRYRFAQPFSEALEQVSEYDARRYSAPDNVRHFILDIGPTNSGKTYAGMTRLKAASNGVYLGPLRLLAMEVAETLNTSGTPCSLLTGEECDIVEGARHIASTVEMLDRACRYEVAVIDECQMIADPERGYAWASAIVSVNAETVHLCLAPEAERLICRMLDGMGEEYEVCYHDRLVPLHAEKSIRYPKDIRQGDAIVVFSRRAVQECADYLDSKGIKASRVYGALPYDVRREEVRKFMDGETQVVVATDAIGMGLNLPVRRVVFAEIEKFDGHEKRQLTLSEIKQIAGRAGRYGKYEDGYATGITPQIADIVEAALSTEIEPADEIRMDMPYRIVEMGYPLSMLMRAWQKGTLPTPYVKRDLTPMIELARRVEDLPNDLVADAIEIPFRSGDRFVPLDEFWERGVRQAAEGREVDIVLYDVEPHDRLQYMEDAAKVADLAYGLAKRYGTPADLEEVDENRRLISKMMIAKMKEEPQKICPWCGRVLPAGFKHEMHPQCHREYRQEQRSYRFGRFAGSN